MQVTTVAPVTTEVGSFVCSLRTFAGNVILKQRQQGLTTGRVGQDSSITFGFRSEATLAVTNGEPDAPPMRDLAQVVVYTVTKSVTIASSLSGERSVEA